MGKTKEVNYFRGVFAPKYKRKVLFTQNMEFKTPELPRRKPKVNVTRRDHALF